MAQTFFVDEGISELFTLDGIITVVDTKYIIKRLDDERPEGVENEAVEQLAFADRILLNKTDLAENEQQLEDIEKRLRTVNPTAPIFRSQQSKVDPLKLINIESFSLDRCLEMDPEFLNTDEEHLHDPTVSSISYRFEGSLNLVLLEDWIGKIIMEFGADLYRYKGVLNVKGQSAKYVFQGVGMLFNGQFRGTWADDEKRENRFVFIGKNLDKPTIAKGFTALINDADLRFTLDDKVYVKLGEPGDGDEDDDNNSGKPWVAGEIVGMWANGLPYEVMLHDGRIVYPPFDNDLYIVARSSQELATACP